MTRFIIDLDGDEHNLVRLLKALLKQLGRVHKVKCRGVRMESPPKETT